MTLANVLHAWSASKSGRSLLDVNVMPPACSAHIFYVWSLLLCHNVWQVASLKGGKEVDNALIRAIGGENAADVWIPRFVFNHKTICAGITLTAEADLTSASCLNDDEPEEAFVVVESHGHDDPPVQVAHIDKCVKFDPDEQHVHDLMVCFHHCQWNFSDSVFLPRISLESHRVPNEFDETCSVMGFGHLTDEGDKCNVLHTMEIRVAAPDDCGSEDNTLQNYVCGETSEQQESCVVGSGEPLLCQHNGSELLIHGISKQEDCSAPLKYTKFLLLSYYREWLEKTVPGLVFSSGSEAGASSEGKDGDLRSERKAGDAVPEQNRQEMGRAEDKAEKCPTLPHPPPVHVHNHPHTGEEHSVEAKSANGDDTPSNSATPNATRSGDGNTQDIQNSDSTTRQPILSAEVSEANQQDTSGAAQSSSVDGASHDTVLLEATARSEAPRAVSSESAAGHHDGAGDISREESLSSSAREEKSDSGNSGLVNAEVPPSQPSPGDQTPVVPPSSAESEINVSVVLASLGDGWYLSNATRSTPHLSGSNESLYIDQLERIISENGGLLNFSYVVEGTNLSLPGYKTSKELTKPGADSPNSVQSNQIKSTGQKSPDGIGKSGQVAVDTVPSDGENASHADSPRDSSVEPHQNASTEVPQGQPAAPGTLTLDPAQWDWLKKNAMRLPKNPTKNPKMLNTKLLFKHPKRKYDLMTRERLAEEYSHRGEKKVWLPDRGKQASLPDRESGFPAEYREMWSAQDLPSSRLIRSYNLEEHARSKQLKPAHPRSNGAPQNSGQPTRGKVQGLPQRSPKGTETHSGEATRHPADVRNRRNAFARGKVPEWRRPASPLTANRRRPEGTYFGVLASSVKMRLKRSGTHDSRHDKLAPWDTLLADLASWPARVGLAPSDLTPRVSFLTAVNESHSDPSSSIAGTGQPPKHDMNFYFMILRTFLPGGNVAKRMELYRKNIIWGPPIVHDEFENLKPSKPVDNSTEDIPEGEETSPPPPESSPPPTSPASPPPTSAPSDATQAEPVEPTVQDEESHRQAREVKNDFPTTAGAGILHGGDVNDIGTELNVTEDHTAGNSNGGSPDLENVSDQSDNRKYIEAETTFSTVNTRKETTLFTADARKETTLSTADARKEPTLSQVNSQKETIVSTANTQRETAMPTSDAGKMSTVPRVGVRRQTLQPTVITRSETVEPREETHSTSFAADYTEGESSKLPADIEDLNDEQSDYFSKIKRLGADDDVSAAHRVASIFGLPLTLLLTWISLPQM